MEKITLNKDLKETLGMLDLWYFLSFRIFLPRVLIILIPGDCLCCSECLYLMYFLCNDREHLERMEQRELLENSEER